MEHLLLDLATRYGYLVVFLGVGIESMGVPLPGETVLLIGAVLAGAGHLWAPLVALAGFLGAVLGDNTGFLVGRRWGGHLMRLPGLRRVYRPERIRAAERLMARHGWLAVFFGRFVAILRIFAGPLAGMHGMPWGRFVVANASGAATWVAAVVVFGLLIGANLDTGLRILRDSGYIGLAVAVVLVATAVGWHIWHSRRLDRLGSGGPPEPPPGEAGPAQPLD